MPKKRITLVVDEELAVSYKKLKKEYEGIFGSKIVMESLADNLFSKK